MPAGEDGTWSGDLLVWDTQFLFEDDSEVAVVPGEDYFVTAVCFLEPILALAEGESSDVLTHVPDEVLEEPEVLFYDEVPFEVTDDDDHVTPPPARPVVEEPVFTG